MEGGGWRRPCREEGPGQHAAGLLQSPLSREHPVEDGEDRGGAPWLEEGKRATPGVYMRVHRGERVIKRKIMMLSLFLNNQMFHVESACTRNQALFRLFFFPSGVKAKNIKKLAESQAERSPRAPTRAVARGPSAHHPSAPAGFRRPPLLSTNTTAREKKDRRL